MKTNASLTRILSRFAVALVLAVSAYPAFGEGPTVIRGTVVDAEANPLAGVTVSALARGSETPSTTVTKKKGTFVLRLPDQDATYLVTFSLDGYVTAELVFREDPENPASVNITLPRQVEQAPPPPVAEDPPPADDEAEAISEQRQAAILVFNEGVDAIQAEDPTTALERFRQAAEIDPAFPEAYRAIAAMAIQVEDYATAADAAEKLLEFQPDDVDTIATAYFSELMLGDTDRMVVSARRLAAANPEIVAGDMLQHAVALFDNDLAGQSRALLEVILEQQPDLAAAQFQLGLDCNMLGDTECTRMAMARFLELAPDDPNAPTARALLDFAASQP